MFLFKMTLNVINTKSLAIAHCDNRCFVPFFYIPITIYLSVFPLKEVSSFMFPCNFSLIHFRKVYPCLF